MIAPATKSTLRVSCASRNGSLNPMMLKAAESRVCRYETTWAIARPPSELSSGMNGDPVCPTPCTASYSAARTTRAESRNAWAAHWRDGGRRPRGAPVRPGPAHEGDVGAAEGVPRGRQPQGEPRAPDVLRVPRDNARLERHGEHAATGDIGALDGLGTRHGPPRQGGAHERECNAERSHSKTAPAVKRMPFRLPRATSEVRVRAPQQGSPSCP